MDDLTKIKGIGKATAKKLAAAGFDTYTALAAATDAASLVTLQDAGFATVDIDAWAAAAAGLIQAAGAASESAAGSAASQGTLSTDGPEREAAGRRRFPVDSTVLHDGLTASPARGDRIALTFDQWRALRAAGAVSVEWEKGDALDA